jgi:hypothetical protein
MTSAAHGSLLVSAFVEVAWFRLLPVLGYALLSRRLRTAQRALAALSLLGWAALCSAWDVPAERLAWAGCATLYVAASAGPVRALAYWVGRGAVSRAACAVLLCFGYLLLPAVALPAERAVYFLVLDWEVALAAYSYVVETGRPGARPNVAECAFFLVVNPLLVYAPSQALVPARPGSTARGFARAVAGLSVMALALPLSAPRALPWAGVLGPMRGYEAFVVNGLLVVVARYAALSGLASFQIGALGALGFALPERYRYPFLARSPADFWRRWNTYIGAWLKRYLFVPLARTLARSASLATRAASRPLGVAATLLGIGAYHDVFVYAASLQWQGRGTQAFGLAAGVMLLWSLVGARARRSRPAARRSPVGVMLSGVLARLAVVHAACAVAWVFTHG